MTDLAWESDAVRLSFDAPLVPHGVPLGYVLAAISWFMAASAAAAIGGASALGWSVVGSADQLGVAVLVAMPALAVVLPVVLVLVLAGVVLRGSYTVTCSQAALRIERPLRPARSIGLEHLETFETSDAGDPSLVVRLDDGEALHLPIPTDPDALASFVAEVAAAQRRVDAFLAELERTTELRERVERVAAAQAATARVGRVTE